MLHKANEAAEETGKNAAMYSINSGGSILVNAGDRSVFEFGIIQ
jgi:hypothetical protein